MGVLEKKLHLAPNGLEDIPFVPRSEARAMLGIKPDELAAVAPCRLKPQKGLRPLLEAMSLTHSPCRLHIFGDGSMKQELIRFVTRKQLRDKVVINSPRGDLRRLLRAFDVGILPSFYEGLSYSLLEMLLADLHVMASDIPANHLPKLQEYITYATPGVPAEWAQKLERLGGEHPSTHDAILTNYPLSAQLDALLACYG